MRSDSRGSEPRKSRKSGRPTIRDVAREAGLSPITASRALRAGTQVSEAARARVAAAVRRLGYVANRAAGTLAGARSNIVPVLVPRIHNAFFSETIEAVAAVLAPRGIDLLVGVHGYDLRREHDQVRSYLAWNPAAMLLAGVDHLPETRRLLRSARLPVVEIWDLAAEPIDQVVGFSHDAVGSAIARLCWAAGFRRPAVIGAHLDRDQRAARRLDGYRRWFAAHRITCRVVAFGAPAAIDHGAEGVARLLAERSPPDVVFCSNDVIALGALFECQRRGVAVPDTVSVVGFGDLPAAHQCVPTLTSVRPRGAEIGRIAAQAVLARVAAGTARRRTRIHDVGFEIVERESTKRTRPVGTKRAGARR